MNIAGASIAAKCSTILLPNHNDKVNRIAVDIGGSLAKVVYFVKSNDGNGGALRFEQFETEHIDKCWEFIRNTVHKFYSQLDSVKNDVICVATGGGSFKFESELKKLGLSVFKEDEMDGLIAGLNFLVREIPDEVYSYIDHENPICHEKIDDDNLFPYLLVNIGSGVSILKVTGDDCYERVSGSSCGGGTLWGLLSLLTPAKSFDEMLELSRTGDNKNVDMLVGDIYGDHYSKIGLSSSTIASSFGKVFKLHKPEHDAFCPNDIAKSLLYMVSNNIGQIAYLNAKVFGIQRIYFGGSYIRDHLDTIKTLSFAVKFWSDGKMKAYFLRHDGYLGSVGAFMRNNVHSNGKLRNTAH